jgi:oxygen-independent coproporphyrinogen-3 oxidase
MRTGPGGHGGHGAAGAAGIEQYEISNFARPGFECLHNVGTGQSAFAGVVRQRPVGDCRMASDPDIERYVAAVEAGEGQARSTGE